jgi:hypothetical protein
VRLFHLFPGHDRRPFSTKRSWVSCILSAAQHIFDHLCCRALHNLRPYSCLLLIHMLITCPLSASSIHTFHQITIGKIFSGDPCICFCRLDYCGIFAVTYSVRMKLRFRFVWPLLPAMMGFSGFIAPCPGGRIKNYRPSNRGA